MKMMINKYMEGDNHIMQCFVCGKKMKGFFKIKRYRG